jgi:MerR family transcriptional regulator, light-induced transcriptional regulator
MDSDTTPRHPIRVVARRTGLTPATIRAWERRYGAVEPTRSDGGQRLYSDRDLERLDTLRRLTEMGRSISSVASLERDEAAELLEEDRSAAMAAQRPLTSADGLDAWTDQAYAHIGSMDDEGLERVLWRAFTTLGAARFIDGVAVPLLHRVGAGWEAGEVSPAQEHLGSEVVERVLADVTDRSIPTEDGPRLIVGTLPGERHGLGGRLVAAAATLEGWSVKYLGTDLPASEIAEAATKLGARAVAISVVTSEIVEDTTRALAELRTLLAPQVALLVGGRASTLLDARRLPAGVSVLDGLGALRALGPAGPGALAKT